ncbi:hypothetical protein TrVFT333_002592 [Trichoderma virens FT-333]|nr:hypothetical protein TrVFT333_002592 [Trichoderma virens FT-333]
MAPSAIPTQDVDLTAANIQVKEATQPVKPSNGTSPAPLDASKLIYNLTKDPRPVPDEDVANASDQTICTDHMVTATWTASAGWATPELKPYGPLSLMPTASVLHYATECFEGLKVYRGYDGKLRIFRPDCNCARMHLSAGRISLPLFEPAELEKLIIALLSVDGPRWLPRSQPGRYLYIRPTLIGTQSQLGVQAPREAMLYIIVTYMPKLDSPLAVGANYGPSLAATSEARSRGYHQILWLYGKDGECTEAGASNFFVVWKRKDGKKELITAPLDDKLILDGVTRRSILELARERLGDELEVTERKYTIDEVIEADAEGRLLESFAAGTAYFVCPVSAIHHRGKDINIPMGPENQPNVYTSKIKTWIGDIMYGNVDHKWGVVIPERE